MKDSREYLEGEGDGLTVESARTYYENAGVDLRLPGKATVSSVTVDSLLIPDWEKARRRSGRAENVLEVPLQYGSDLEAFVMNVGGSSPSHGIEQMHSRLIFTRSTGTGSLSCYVATFIFEEGTFRRPISRVSYLGDDGGFSGLILYSTMGGEFLSGRQFVDGVWTHDLRLRGDSSDSSGSFIRCLFVLASQLTRGNGESPDKSDEPIWTIEINPVEVVSPRPDPPVDPPGILGGGDGGDGGGNGGDSGSSGGSSTLSTSTPEQARTKLLNKLTNSIIRNVINGNLVSFFAKTDGPIMTINCRYYVGIIRYEIHEISYNIQIYSQLTEQGKEISILHEYMHPTLFFQGKPHDHNAFINDSVWQQGIRDIFPGKSNDFYNAMQYYGCEDVLNEMVNSGKMTESEKSRIKGIIQSHLLQ